MPAGPAARAGFRCCFRGSVSPARSRRHRRDAGSRSPRAAQALAADAGLPLLATRQGRTLVSRARASGDCAAGGSVRRARRARRQRPPREPLGASAAGRRRGIRECADERSSAASRPDPLAVLLNDPSITEVIANGPAEVWVERRGRLQRAALRFDDAERSARRLRAAGRARGPPPRRRAADGRRASRRRLALERRAAAARAGRTAADAAPVHATTVHARPSWSSSARSTEADADAARRLRARAPVDRDQRRHVERQDVAAGRARRVHRRARADRHGGGRRRAAHRSAARRAPGGPRSESRGHAARSASGSSCATRCGCGPTDWSWARCVAARRSTCSRR